MKRLNLIGQKFGRWTVMGDGGRNIKSNKSLWECQCKCGTVKIIIGSSLKQGCTNSCGCLKNELTSKRQKIDLIGQRFNNLIIIGLAGKDKHGELLWKCKCDCGNIKNIKGYNLKNGHIKSCGCLRIGNVRTKKSISGFNSLYYTYKKGAKKRNLEFELTKEEFRKLTKQNCHYCGIEPNQNQYGSRSKLSKFTKEWGKCIYNGIDRKDNNKGYIIENCLSCCGICNKMKLEMTYDDFINHIKKIAINLQK